MSETMQDRLRRYVELSNLKRDLDAKLKEVKADAEAVESVLLKEFEESGTSSVKVDGMTVYLHRQLWAGPVEGDKQAACEALKAAGYVDYVSESYNSNSLSSLVRELEKNGDDLPPEFEGKIKVSEVFALRTRRA